MFLGMRSGRGPKKMLMNAGENEKQRLQAGRNQDFSSEGNYHMGILMKIIPFYFAMSTCMRFAII